MKFIHFTKIFVFLLLSLFFVSFIGVPEDINKALKEGDFGFLKENMNETVELVILEKENVYSKTQAEQILKNFFNSHKPIGFEVLHNGGSDKSKYYIGTLKTERKAFRVYYLLKVKNDKTLIYQLRIESDE